MALPVPAIIAIVLSAWVLIILIAFGVYQFLKTREVIGKCECCDGVCGNEGNPRCSQCCISMSESCDCCSPSINGCLNKICPDKKVDCVDILLCQCCASPGEQSCCAKLCNDFGTLQSQNPPVR